MTFDSYLDQAWTDHAKDSKMVAASFSTGFELLEKEEQISQLVHLITHVAGDHLGDWNLGLRWIEKVQSLKKFTYTPTTKSAVDRFKAILELAANGAISLESFNISDQVRIYAGAACSLGGNSDPQRATEYFHKAISLLSSDWLKSDPAYRSLAANGNILATTLEDKSERSTQETELMLFAARTGRKFWEIAGTWKEVERAEYRLANSYLKANDIVRALEHAQLCLEGCLANQAPALEFFYGYEALAKIERVRKNSVGLDQAVQQMQKYFNELSPEDQKWSRASLENFTQEKKTMN